ncbi:hypothetical protein J2802_000098 [Paraburkholderia caribensis]|nr:hypothetical protein [Paraburkholderia caribensis]
MAGALDRRLIGSKSLKLNEFLMTPHTVLVLGGSVFIILGGRRVRLSYAVVPRRRQRPGRMK